MRRRNVPAALAAIGLCSGRLPAAAQAPAGASTWAVPGPRNSVSLPLELAHRLEFDKRAGLPLRIAFVGGGGVAIQELRQRNVEFAVFGLPALVRANLGGGLPMVGLAAIDDLPLYTLVVRTDLRQDVRRVGDLAGRTLGVHSNSLQVRTTSHQLADLVLRTHGVDPATVRVLAAGQSWETQSAMLVARRVDATMCDEPFATRLEAEGIAFKLFSTGDPSDAASVPGAGFLRATLVTLRETAERSPARAEQAVQLMREALRWIGANSPAAFADALGMEGAERASFLAVAQRYPRQYSPDGRFSQRQVADTEAFFRASNADLPGVGSVRIGEMLLTRWAGTKA